MILKARFIGRIKNRLDGYSGVAEVYSGQDIAARVMLVRGVSVSIKDGMDINVAWPGGNICGIVGQAKKLSWLDNLKRSFLQKAL